MNFTRRIEALEDAAMRQGADAFSRRLAERLRNKSPAELAALGHQLETFLATGNAAPGLVETLTELTEP